MSDEAWTFRDRVLWLAALYDGEGSFGAGRAQALRLALRMTDRDTVERAYRFTGAESKLFTTTAARREHKEAYGFVLGGPLAAGWMMILYPVLSARRQAKIRTVLAVWRSRKVAGRYRRACPRGHPYSPITRGLRGGHGRGRRYCRICGRNRQRVRAGRTGRKTTDTRTAALFPG